MATYQFSFHEFRDFAFAGGAGSLRPGQGLISGSFRLTGGAAAIDISVKDGDTPPAATTAQQLAAPVTVNGTTYPAGARIGLEFAIATNSTAGSGVVFYYVRIDGVNVGIAAGAADFAPGVTYAITGSQDGDGVISGVFPTRQPTAVPWDTLACFTHGTLIETPDGPRLIETLAPGDLVTTLGNGSQPLRWIGTRALSPRDMLARADLRPVLFEAGTFGNSRALMVSPRHRMLLNDWRAEVYFGEDEVLIAAKALVNGKTVRQVVPGGGVVYCHLLFDQHEVILAEGALSESFHPGEIGLGALDEAQRQEIAALFPELEFTDWRAAFPIVRNAEARALPLVN